jgi:hypothetical protein
MPTNKPRVTVTLDPETYRVLHRWSSLQKRSIGKVMSELLDSVIEPLDRAADLMEAAANAPDNVKRGMVSAMTSVESDILAAYSTIQEALDTMDSAAGDDGNPRTCNTGVRFGRTPKSGESES